MATFEIRVELYMQSPVTHVAPDSTLEQANLLMQARGISCAAVVAGEQLVGVVSRTDLLRVGRRAAGSDPGATLLELPDQRVSEVMSSQVFTVAPDTALSVAAEAMWKREFHRVFVVQDGRLAGVLSTRDIMLAVRDQRVSHPIERYMSSPLFTVGAAEPISVASNRLENAGISGLLVVDDDWPVGFFTQVEALISRREASDTPVENVMNTAFVCMPIGTPMFRAAAQAESLRARRIVAVKDRDVRGILTGIDFARCAAESVGAVREATDCASAGHMTCGQVSLCGLMHAHLEGFARERRPRATVAQAEPDREARHRSANRQATNSQ